MSLKLCECSLSCLGSLNFLATHPWSRGNILIRRNDLLICPLITLTSLIVSLIKFSCLKYLKVIQIELKSTSNHFWTEVSTKEFYIWAAKWRGRCLGGYLTWFYGRHLQWVFNYCFQNNYLEFVGVSNALSVISSFYKVFLEIIFLCLWCDS